MGWPTTDDPKIKFVTTRFTENERAELDLYARSSGHKASEYVRDAVAEKIEREKKRERKQKGRR